MARRRRRAGALRRRHAGRSQGRLPRSTRAPVRIVPGGAGGAGSRAASAVGRGGPRHLPSPATAVRAGPDPGRSSRSRRQAPRGDAFASNLLVRRGHRGPRLRRGLGGADGLAGSRPFRGAGRVSNRRAGGLRRHGPAGTFHRGEAPGSVRPEEERVTETTVLIDDVRKRYLTTKALETVSFGVG